MCPLDGRGITFLFVRWSGGLQKKAFSVRGANSDLDVGVVTGNGGVDG
jgi:hypothetical protein